MTGVEILWPVLLLIAVTLALYVFTFLVRVRLVRQGETRVSEFRTYENEHIESRKWARAIANQFELPVLFYVVCIAALVTGQVGTVLIVLAWIFAITKTLHVYLHVTANRLRYRQPVFSGAYFALIVMTGWLALSLSGLV